MANGKTAQRPNRRQDILDCFSDMVAERGYDDVTLRDIAAHLDMSKGTILHHFGNKERLLERVHAEYMERRLAECRLIIEWLESPPEQLWALVYQLVRGIHEDYAATVAFAREMMRFASEDIMGDVRSMRDEFTQVVRDVIVRGMKQGYFAKADPQLVTLAVFGMANWSWTWYRPAGSWTPEKIGDTFASLLLDGLLKDGHEVKNPKRLHKVVGRAMAEVAATREPA